MVSKVAVIAIVAILAVPILLGYAMNVEQVTETDYKKTGETVDVTQLLQSGIGYSMSNADVYQMNSKTNPYKPIYNTVSYQKTSMPVQQYRYDNSVPGEDASGDYPHAILPLNTFSFMYLNSNITNTSTGWLNFTLYDPNDAPLVTINKILTVTWKLETSTVTTTYIDNSGNFATNNTYVADANQKYAFTHTGNYTATGYLERIFSDGSTNTYADISDGYYFTGSFRNFWTIDIPDYTSKAILTIDLNSITADNYTIKIGAGGHNNGVDFNSSHPYYLTKTTTAGVVTWTVTSVRAPIHTWELYYDPNIPHNTYQIYWDWIYDHSGEPYYYVPLEMDFHDMYYNSHREFRYVGNWPDAIGEANVYWKITDDIEWYVSAPMPYELPDYVPANYTDYNFSHFYFSVVNSDQEIRTPTARVDAALFRAFEYQVIEDRVYDPAAFKTNPSTTIDNLNLYGSSFTFGGNTYNVKNGNITMGTHDISVKGLTLSSIPNPNGGYDNKIGNTVISTTAAPSTITFNGRWSASIITSAQEEYEITKTEWKAGDFAWDGMDHNFIMAGLLASLGAFVGVGIYARRTKATVWPLLIVCGGAALLFFVML